MPERSSKSRCPCNWFVCCNKQVNINGFSFHLNWVRMESTLGTCVVSSSYQVDASPTPETMNGDTLNPSKQTTEKTTENVTTEDGRNSGKVALPI